MYLIDTNVWVELLLEQQRAKEVKRFFQEIEASQLAITEFSLYSIGIILDRLGKSETYADFISDTIENSGVKLIRLSVKDLKEIYHIWKQFNLDFDDSYQYLSALKHGYIIISFDKDFDRTDRKRKMPAEILKEHE